MAATLVSSKLHALNGDTSLTGANVVAVFFVNVSEGTTPQRVIELAQGADNSDDENRPVPPLEAAFSTHLDGQTTADASIICSQIRAMQRESGPDARTKWRVEAVYSAASNSGATGQGRELDLNPVDRKARFRTEQVIINEPRDRAANKEQITYPFLDSRKDTATQSFVGFRGRPRIRYADQFIHAIPNGYVTDASGRRVADIPTYQRRLPVFVMKTNTLDPFSWIDIVHDFTDDEEDEEKPFVNSGDWDVFGTGKIVSDRSCMFFGAETSDPLYWGNVIYYELTVKVLYDRRGHDIRVRNEGVDFWRELSLTERQQIEKREGAEEGAIREVRDVSFASGLPVPPPIQLDINGRLREDQTEQAEILTFRDLKAVPFHLLTTAINNA